MRALSRSLQPAAGRLLVATPTLQDPNFSRTVVLIGRHHVEAGSFGIVLNRPLKVNLTEVLNGLPTERAEKLWLGGPVQPEELQVLHRIEALASLSTEVAEGLWLGQGAAFAARVLFSVGEDPEGRHYRCFAGYAGWGTGQLQAEISERSWVVVPCGPEAPFGSDTDLWAEMSLRAVLPGGRDPQFINKARQN